MAAASGRPAGSPSRKVRPGGHWESSLRPRPKPERRRPKLEPPAGWESSVGAAISRGSPLRARTNVDRTMVGPPVDSTHSRMAKGLDGTVRVSRTIRVTPPRQRPGQPEPPVSYLITTVAKSDELPPSDAASSFGAQSSFGQSSEAWSKQEAKQYDEQQHQQHQQTFVGVPARDASGDGDSSFPLSLLRSRRDTPRASGVEQSVSFAPSSPARRPLERHSVAAAAPDEEERAATPDAETARTEAADRSTMMMPSAGKIRRQQRFGKGLRRGGPDRGRPWVIESATDDRAPLPQQPSQAPPMIERRLLRCGILLLRWTVRKQRGLARWWFLESLKLQDDQAAAEAPSRRAASSSSSARARGERSTTSSAGSRSRSSQRGQRQRRSRSPAEKLAAEGGWRGGGGGGAAGGSGAEERRRVPQQSAREKAARAESSAFDRAMAATLRRKSALKWAFVALKADVVARVLSRRVASCSCCVRDARRLLRGWTALHENWLAAVESMRVAHAQKIWLCRSHQRRLLRAWQRRAEWWVPRRRKAMEQQRYGTQARALDQLCQGATLSRWKRTLSSVAGARTSLLPLCRRSFRHFRFLSFLSFCFVFSSFCLAWVGLR